MPDSFDSIDPPSPSLNQRTAGHDDTLVEGPSADADGGAVAAAFYGVTPLHVSFAKAAAIESAANFLQRTADGAIFTNQSNGPNSNSSSNDKDDDSEDPALAAYREIVQQQQEAAYWSDKTVSWSGYNLTGAQWHNAAETMRSEEFRKRMREAGKAAGYSDDQMDKAEQLAPDIAERLSHGKKPTADEEAKIKANPMLQMYLDKGIEHEQGIELTQSPSHRHENTEAEKVGESRVVTVQDDLTDNHFPASLSLRETYKVAALGEAPANAMVDKVINRPSPSQQTGLDI